MTRVRSKTVAEGAYSQIICDLPGEHEGPIYLTAERRQWNQIKTAGAQWLQQSQKMTDLLTKGLICSPANSKP